VDKSSKVAMSTARYVASYPLLDQTQFVSLGMLNQSGCSILFIADSGITEAVAEVGEAAEEPSSLR
jgi:hypothetical protein